MPTLLEVWLAEQTADRLPWQHLPIGDGARHDGSTGCHPLDHARGWLDRWRRVVSLIANTAKPVPVTCNNVARIDTKISHRR